MTRFLHPRHKAVLVGATALVLALGVFASTASAAQQYAITDIPSWTRTHTGGCVFGGQGFCIDTVEATGINNSGEVIGNTTYNPGDGSVYGFLYEGGNMTLLTGFAGIEAWETRAADINDAGQVVGWAALQRGTAPQYRHAFRYTAGTMLDLGRVADCGALPQPDQGYTDNCDDSAATNIDAAGRVFGYGLVSPCPSPCVEHSFLWDGAMHDVGSTGIAAYPSFFPLPGTNKWGQSVSGDVVSDGQGHSHPISTLIGAPDWSNIDARDINDKGQIVGSGDVLASQPFDPSLAPFQHGFVVSDTAPPDCSLVDQGKTRGRKFLKIEVQDALSGLDSIVVTEAPDGAAITTDTYQPGTFGAVDLTASGINPGHNGTLTLSVSDIAGNIASCTYGVGPGNP